jgi:methionyl-tRNA synthetase
MKTSTITTPIYYVNDVPHIGHAYTTVAADVWARWKRLRGERAFFLTGTDEHGDKIAQAAAARGETPQAFADRIVEGFRGLWKKLNISHDDFIRTTESRHERVVQGIFEKMKAKGDIVKGVYEDWYCVPDETFFSTSQLRRASAPTAAGPWRSSGRRATSSGWSPTRTGSWRITARTPNFSSRRTARPRSSTSSRN